MRWGWLIVWASLVLLQLVALYTPDAGGGPGFLAPLWEFLGRIPGPIASGMVGIDKIAHAVMFGVVTAAGLLTGWPRWFAIGFPLLHAPVSELVQRAWIPGRGGEWGDLLADLIGIGIGIAVVLIVMRRNVQDPVPRGGERENEERYRGRPIGRM